MSDRPSIGDLGGSLDEYKLFLAMRKQGAVFVAFLPEHVRRGEGGTTTLRYAITGSPFKGGKQ